MRRNDFFKYLLLGGGGSASRSELEIETLPYTFVSKSQRLRNYRIYGNTVDGESVGDLVTEGEHAGEYRVPVTVTNGTDTETTNIYLPEQIKMVGDEAEYVDYGQQKQHRVRKNLLLNTATSQTINGITFTVNTDGSVTCNGRREQTSTFFTIGSVTTSGEIILSGCPSGGSNTSFVMRAYSATISNPRIYYEIGDSCMLNTPDTYNIDIRIQSNYACDNLTFYPMIRKADIEDDTYEPYIQDTELDVEIPTLPTIAGTNTLSVGTTVQPSKIWIQGNISEIETVSVQALQANMQSLQPFSLDENLGIDVMPTDNDLQPDVMQIEKPVLNLNDISEIENAEIERGVESAE